MLLGYLPRFLILIEYWSVLSMHGNDYFSIHLESVIMQRTHLQRSDRTVVFILACTKSQVSFLRRRSSTIISWVNYLHFRKLYTQIGVWRPYSRITSASMIHDHHFYKSWWDCLLNTTWSRSQECSSLLSVFGHQSVRYRWDWLLQSTHKKLSVESDYRTQLTGVNPEPMLLYFEDWYRSLIHR